MLKLFFNNYQAVKKRLNTREEIITALTTELGEKTTILTRKSHSAIAFLELHRLLFDRYKLSFEQALLVCQKVFVFEKMESDGEFYDVAILEELLPRHLQILYHINHIYLQKIQSKFPNNNEMLKDLSVIEEGKCKRFRLAHFCYAIGQQIILASPDSALFQYSSNHKDYFKLLENESENSYIKKVIPQGCNQRFWVHAANPPLSDLLTRIFGNDDWIENFQSIRIVGAIQETMKEEWAKIKIRNKSNLADLIKRECGITIPTSAFFYANMETLGSPSHNQLLSLFYHLQNYNAFKEDNLTRVLIYTGRPEGSPNLIELIRKLSKHFANIPKSSVKIVYIPYESISKCVIISSIDACEFTGPSKSRANEVRSAMNGLILVGASHCVSPGMARVFGKFCYESSPKEFADLSWVRNCLLDGQFGDLKNLHSFIMNSISSVAPYYSSYASVQDMMEKHFYSSSKWFISCINNIAQCFKFSSDSEIHKFLNFFKQIFQTYYN